MNFFKKLVQRLLPPETVTTSERRTSVRLNFAVDIEVQSDSVSFPAKVLNLTFTGLCVETPVVFEEGQEVTLKRPESGPPFRATVLWCKPKSDQRYLLGLECELDEEKLIGSWLEPALIEAGFLAEYLDEKRTLVRVPGKIDCRLAETSGKGLGSGKMLDLSLGGALLEWATELPTEVTFGFETVALGKLGGLSGTVRAASCRKSEDGIWLVGLQFEEVDLEKVKQYMASMIAT